MLKEYIVHVKKVLKKIKKYKLFLYSNKSKFYITKIEYLEFIILRERVFIDLKKIVII